MKKLFITLLTFGMLIGFSGCSTKEKINNKITEEIIEKSTGNEADIKGDTIIIKNEDGETLTFGHDEWPTSQLAKNIPEFKDGTINSVMESNDTLVITLESVEKEDVLSYWETLKKDFPKEVYEMNSEDFISFTGTNNHDITVSVSYMDNALSISVIDLNE
ncbi:MAG: hypothetical protein GX778_02475 [Erysipelothrix sp.]|nr:hypothetical protein [Erysipelothrix sp.]